MNANVLEKLKILAESAKYDVSCASSGTVRSNKPGMLGNTVGGWGICHSFAEDGRCISLLKVMLTNYCIYDCAYCINRRSNDLPRATLSVSELVDLTIEFYRRNYIEGLFLSSGVVRNPDYTMERLVRVAKDLREVHRFNGYIHLKSIPGASRELVNEAGRYADRLSVNVEIPKEENLKLLAPEKDHKSVFAPMLYIQQGVLESSEERKKFRYAPRFAPAGQSTQMIVGATAETDKDILFLSSALYQRPTMKRVYYSGYVSVNTYDTRLPALKQPPLVRENRLYQADWLMRFYQFKVDEIASLRVVLARINQKGILGDDKVRAAVISATDRKNYADVLLKGTFIPGSAPIPPSMDYGFKDLKDPNAYNPERSKQLLAEDGWKDTDGDGILDKDGKPLTFNFVVYNSRAELPLYAEAVQADLKKVGIDMKIKTVDYNLIDKMGQDGDYDMLISNIVTANTGDPIWFLANYWHTNDNGSNPQNGSGYSNPQVDQLLDAAETEFDPAKRRDYAIQIQQLLMNDGAALFLGYPKTNIVTGSYLKGAVMYPSDYYWITNKITK